MILKILLFAIVVGAVYLFFIKERTASEPSSKKEDEEVMVECSKCKTFISTKEAIIKDGKYYCSKECAKKG